MINEQTCAVKSANYPQSIGFAVWPKTFIKSNNPSFNQLSSVYFNYTVYMWRGCDAVLIRVEYSIVPDLFVLNLKPQKSDVDCLHIHF